MKGKRLYDSIIYTHEALLVKHETREAHISRPKLLAPIKDLTQGNEMPPMKMPLALPDIFPHADGAMGH
jgi:hypothetical protein